MDIAEARGKSARETLLQYKANMGKAEHELDEIYITAEMSGIITALNVEEGESAIMGTMNNPGTVLLTIADLSEMEARRRKDEQMKFQHAEASALGTPSEGGASGAEQHTPFVRDCRKVGRNEACPCGSGKKFKQCHGSLG